MAGSRGNVDSETILGTPVSSADLHVNMERKTRRQSPLFLFDNRQRFRYRHAAAVNDEETEVEDGMLEAGDKSKLPHKYADRRACATIAS